MCALLVDSKPAIVVSVLACSFAQVIAATPFEATQPKTERTGSPLFTEASGVIPFEKRSRRKFDAPVVADFDQDGRLDLMITEHGRAAYIFWNNKEVFSPPQKVIDGDTHGVAVGDYDQDGRVDLIISQGGGDGKKPRNPVAFHVNRDRTIDRAGEFEDFVRCRGRATKLIDWDGDGHLDFVHSAFPLKTQPQGANQLYNNDGSGALAFTGLLPQAQWMGFRLLQTDFENDGHPDLLFYGGNDIAAVRATGEMSFANVTAEVLGPHARIDHVSDIAEIDFDNDGDFDLLLTREDYPFDPKTHYDPQGKRFAFFSRFKPAEYDDLQIAGDFKLENLQMAYPHFDVFVGADKRLLTFDVDRHGHKDFVLKPEEATGWPEERSDKGLYIGHLGDGVWRVAVDTKSPTAGVIHSVVSQPTVNAEAEMPVVLLENRDGVFVDVTQRLGIAIPEQCSSTVAGDFNNDGWCDLVVIRRGNPATPTDQFVLFNQQGERFEMTTDAGLHSPELGATGGGAEAFDYDSDGDLDLVYACERGRWRLFTNNANEQGSGNYLVFRIGQSPLGKATAQGATLTLEAGGHTYRRVVGSTSAAHSHSLNNHLHVGLGSVQTVAAATVQWTNGESVTIRVDGLNQTIDVGRSGTEALP